MTNPDLQPCGSGECGRLVSALSHYCCAPCRVAWLAYPRYEPHAHSPDCDDRDALRRSTNGATT